VAASAWDETAVGQGGVRVRRAGRAGQPRPAERGQRPSGDRGRLCPRGLVV